MATIDNLSLEINTVDNNAVAGLTRLVTALSSLKGSLPSKSRLSGVAQGINEISAAANGISEDGINKIERLASALSRLSSVRGLSTIARATSAMRTSRSTGSSTGLRTTMNQIVPVTVTEEPYDGEKETTETPSTGSYRETSSEEKKASVWERIRDAIKSARKELPIFGSAVRQAFGSVVRRDLDNFGRAIKSLTNPIRNFLRSLGRIALYRFLRGVIKSITQGIAEGTKNLALFSAAMGGLDVHNANRVLSLYASNFMYLKNTIGTAVIPILRALEPVIDMVTKAMVRFGDVVAQMASSLFGTQYTKAKYYYIDYAQSVDKASGSVGKMNKQLAKFDELNNLTTKEGSGNELDYSSMFEDPAPIEDWILALKDMDARGVGTALSLRLRDAFRGIDWESIFNGARTKGSGLAEFFNGLIRPDTAYEIGRALINVFNAGLIFFNSFASDMDWANVGASIAGFLNGIVENIKPKEIAGAINNVVNGLFNIVYGFATEFDWIKFLNNIFGVLQNLDFTTWSVIFGGFFVKIMTSTAFTSAIGASSAEIWAGVIAAIAGGLLIGNGLGQIFSAIFGDQDSLEMYQDLNPFTSGKLGEITYDFFEPVFDFWKDPWAGMTGLSWKDWWNRERQLSLDNLMAVADKQDADWKEFWQDFVDFWSDPWAAITGQTWKDYWSKNKYEASDVTKGLTEPRAFTKSRDAGANIIRGVNKGIEEETNKSSKKTSENVFTKIFNAIKNAFGISSPAKSMYPIGENTVLGIFEGFNLVNFSQKMSQWWNSNVIPWFSQNKWKEIGNNIQSGLSGAFNTIQSSWNNLRSQIMNNPIQASVAIQQSVGTVISTATSGADAGVAALQQVLNQINKTPAETNVGGKSRGSTTKTKPAKPTGMPEAEYQRWLKSLGFAQGGYPGVGSLFIAGENGAELVGNFNGRTGVANNDQIVDAMYAATYDAMSKALSENNMSVIVEGDADGMFRAFQRKANDFYTRTGRPAI